MDFEARSAAMQASMAMMQREATIAAATAKIPHHREGGIDMTKVRPEAKAAPESAEDRARRLQKDARCVWQAARVWCPANRDLCPPPH